VGNHCSPTRQKRVKNDFGEYFHPSTSHSGEFTCLVEIRSFAARQYDVKIKSEIDLMA
jgi:hypothetical protein